jgi:lipoate---protein ligase
VTWALERSTGSAAEFHARPIPSPARRVVWAFDVDRPAVVLGSAQPARTIDEAQAAARGIAVVRRRSGGGAVLLQPGATLWVDVVVPAADPLWDDDVGRAAWWLGEAWVSALRACGVGGGVVHRGRLVSTRWSAVVCFAGLGPGEVTVHGAKAVGISQRRTREAARFQCAVVHRWDPAVLVSLLNEPRPDADELAPLVREVDVPDDELLAALLDVLSPPA